MFRDVARIFNKSKLLMVRLHRASYTTEPTRFLGALESQAQEVSYKIKCVKTTLSVELMFG